MADDTNTNIPRPIGIKPITIKPMTPPPSTGEAPAPAAPAPAAPAPAASAIKPIAIDPSAGGKPLGPVTNTAMFPKEAYLHRRCDVHRPRTDGAVEARWPADTRHWDLAGVPDAAPPRAVPADADTTGEESGRVLAIKAPVENATYVLSGEQGQDRIRLEANTRRERLQWYLNGRYLGVSDDVNPLFLDLVPGEHSVACMSADGRTNTVRFLVAAN